MWYHTSSPGEYLAITGQGIQTVEVKKKAFVRPFQQVKKFSVQPWDLALDQQVMTVEKLNLILPAVFTIGPAVPDDEENPSDALNKYATLLTGDGNYQDIVRGILEGEVRAMVSSMSMEEIFKERKMFKDRVTSNIQSELVQFGLKIYNSNIRELRDAPGSDYFATLSLKASEGAINQAKIDVAAARSKGEIGATERQGYTKQKISEIEANTSIAETQRKKDKATAEASYAVRQTELDMEIQQAKIKAKRAAEARDAELSKDVERKRADTELERLRANDVVKSKIAKEQAQQAAEADFFTKQKAADGKQYQVRTSADAELYQTQQQAEARQFNELKSAEAKQLAKEKGADGDFYSAVKDSEARKMRKTVDADAEYYASVKQSEAALIAAEKEAEALFVMKKREAEGMIEMAKGYGALSEVLGGPAGLMQFLMIERGVYKELADSNAKAINGLQPKINVWNTGASEGGAAADPTASIRNLMQNLPPLFSTIQDQTGIGPPAWLASMPNQQQQQSQAGAVVNPRAPVKTAAK